MRKNALFLVLLLYTFSWAQTTWDGIIIEADTKFSVNVPKSHIERMAVLMCQEAEKGSTAYIAYQYDYPRGNYLVDLFTMPPFVRFTRTAIGNIITLYHPTLTYYYIYDISGTTPVLSDSGKSGSVANVHRLFKRDTGSDNTKRLKGKINASLASGRVIEGTITP